MNTETISDAIESQGEERENWKQRWGFLILSGIIMVFYSEKMYWYIQGYSYVELVLWYLIGAYSFFWAISYFRINHFWPMFLAAVLYPLYVEGAFTGIITADLTTVMLAYFVGWHTTLSVIVGWYYHRKWLIHDEKRKLIGTSILLGLFFGVWASTFWLPENVNDPELSIENGFMAGQWSILDYSLLLLYLGAIYVISHYLLGRWSIWSGKFTPTKIENILFALSLLLFLSLQLFAYGVLALYLVILYLVVLWILSRYKAKRMDDTTIFQKLRGRVRLDTVLTLYLIPIFAILGYSFMYIGNFGDNLIRVLFTITYSTQVIYGYVLMLFAGYKTIKFQAENGTDEI